MSSSLNFNCALVTGGAGGIGKAISQYLIRQGKSVLIAGRTESKLKDTSEGIGATGYYVLDTGDTQSISAFVRKITNEHPELDCVVNNAGVQRPLDIVKDLDFLEKADEEIHINIQGPMHLTMHLLPHLQKQRNAAIVNISSVLGFVPFSVINPVYNGTKAWLHFWTMNLRSQLSQSDTTSHIKVIEIAPPTVGTDLHRERSNPDDNKKENNEAALTVDEFMKVIIPKLENGDDMIAAGMANDIVKQWHDTMGQRYQ